MSFFDAFKSFDLILISQYMAVEFLIGIIAGIIVKYLAKFNASRVGNAQVFSAKDYSSIHFGKDFPRRSFDLLSLPPEFVIVQHTEQEVVCEEFFTIFGSSIKAEYRNGQYRMHGISALSSPLYLFTVVIPTALGFFSASMSLLDKIGILLLISGVVWIFITSLVQMLLMFPKPKIDNAE
jgi:hypothetical protein